MIARSPSSTNRPTVIAPFDTIPAFNQLAGTASSPYHTPQTGLFWALDGEHQGQGYATEAARALIDFVFTSLSLKQCVALTEYDNHASIAVMRRRGMTSLHNPYPAPEWFQVVGVLLRPV